MAYVQLSAILSVILIIGMLEEIQSMFVIRFLSYDNLQLWLNVLVYTGSENWLRYATHFVTAKKDFVAAKKASARKCKYERQQHCHATLGCVCMIMWDLGRKEQQLRISIRVVRLRLVKTVRILE